MKNEKIGLIDVGGGLRDIFGAGVTDYLIDNNIEIPYTIGISAGSANMASYISKQKGRNRRFYEIYSMQKKYMGIDHLLKTGSYINFDYIYKELSNSNGLDSWDFNKAMKSNQEMIVVATNAKTGNCEYFYKRDFKEDNYGFFSASCSIPILNKPYKFNNEEYIDGAISNPIPYEKAFKDGCTKLIIILTRPIDFRKENGRESKFYKKWEKKYPNLIDKLYNRCNLYNEQLESIIKISKEKNNILIIAPDHEDVDGLKTLTRDLEKLDNLYFKGYKKASLIKDFLKSN